MRTLFRRRCLRNIRDVPPQCRRGRRRWYNRVVPVHPSSPKRAAAAVLLSFVAGMAFGAGGCGPRPQQLLSPTPRRDALGAYLVPYNTDGTLTEWARRALTHHRERRAARNEEARWRGAAIVAGYAVVREDPSVLATKYRPAQWVDRRRPVALKASGGEAFMRATSDQSFDRLDDLIVYMYVNGKLPRHREMEVLLRELYPKYRRGKASSLAAAEKKPKAG